MVISWCQYLFTSPEHLLKYYLSFYGITITLKLRMFLYSLKNSLIKMSTSYRGSIISWVNLKGRHELTNGTFFSVDSIKTCNFC